MADAEKQLTQSETRFLVSYLQLECEHMDRLIACAQRLKTTLTRQTVRALPDDEKPDQQNVEAQVDAETFSPDSVQATDPLKEARNRLLQLLKSLTNSVSPPPSLVSLIANTSEPQRAELMEYRNRLKQKLMELATVNAGSQAVLVYTMDYYEKFLSGISGVDVSSQVYTSHGKMLPHFKSFTRTTV